MKSGVSNNLIAHQHQLSCLFETVCCTIKVRSVLSFVCIFQFLCYICVMICRRFSKGAGERRCLRLWSDLCVTTWLYVSVYGLREPYHHLHRTLVVLFAFEWWWCVCRLCFGGRGWGKTEMLAGMRIDMREEGELSEGCMLCRAVFLGWKEGESRADLLRPEKRETRYWYMY